MALPEPAVTTAPAVDGERGATTPADPAGPTGSHTARPLPYRPAIDGLRAIAVLAVVVYHAAPGLAPSGWLGVDVFFVISGFLITALLLVEYRQWGDIDFLAFWGARARRLLPAVVVLVLAVLVASAVLTPENRRGAVAGDALASLFYVANWRFMLSDEAYFAAVATPSPLRHMWSLAVEEQFYILFPLLMFLLLTRLRLRRSIGLVLGGLALLSVLVTVALFEPGIDPARVYYGTDTRAHELLIGSLAAVVSIRGGTSLSRRFVTNLDRGARLLSPVALLALLAAFFVPGGGQELVFRGGSVLLSLLVCCVLLTAVSGVSSPVRAVLSVAPLRLIGLVSYSLYLWHWPVIVFLTSDRVGVDGWLLAVLQVALSFALAVASYHLVEIRVRRRGVRGLVPRLPRLSTAVAVAAIPLVALAALGMPAAASRLPTATVGTGARVEAQYVPNATYSSLLVVGNSIPKSLLDNFDPGRYPDLQVDRAVNIGCDPLPDPKIVDGREVPVSAQCADWQAGWPQNIESTGADTVVLFISQSWVNDREVGGRRLTFGTAEYRQYLARNLDDIRATVRRHGASRLALVNVSCHRVASFSDELKRVSDDQTVAALNDAVGDWAARRDVPVIDQHELLCGDGYTDAVNGVPLYVDDLHFSAQSAEQVWPWFAQQFQMVAAEPAR